VPADPLRLRQVVEAFLAASRGGDFEGLLALLDPDVVLRADARTVTIGATAETLGAREVAATFAGRASAARLALVDGAPGAVWAPGGRARVVFAFTIADGRIVAIEMVSDPATVGRLDLTIVEPPPADKERQPG